MRSCRMGIAGNLAAYVAMIHAVVLIVAVVLGAHDAEDNSTLTLVNLPESAILVVEKATDIALKNTRAMIVMLGLGIASVGWMPSMLLALNGYGAGRMVASWFDSQPDVAVAMLQYLPLEFVSMFLASCASSYFGLSVLWWSMGSESVKWERSRDVFLMAFVLMLLAAVVEAVSGLDLWRMTT